MALQTLQVDTSTGRIVGAKSAHVAMVGAISAGGSVTITHNLNNWNVNVVVTRSYLITGALTAAVAGAVVNVNWRKAGPNAVVLESDVDVAADEYIVAVTPGPGEFDVTGPTAGTLSSPTQSLTSITLSLSGGTDAGVGLAGVNWYRNGSLIGTTAGDTFEHTGLTQNTEYDGYTAKRFDLFGTEGSVSNTLNDTFTLAPAAVAGIGTGVSSRDAADGTASVDWTAAAGGNRLAIARVSVSHSEWVASANYDTMTVVGSVTGAWTKLTISNTFTDVGNAFGQPSGYVGLFYIKESAIASFISSDPDDTETVTVTFADTATTEVAATIRIDQFSGVDQTTPFGTVAGANADGPQTITVSCAVDDMVIWGWLVNDSTVVSGDFNRTTDYVSPTAASAGYGKHTLFGRLPATGTSHGGTLSYTGAGVGWGVPIKKAT